MQTQAITGRGEVALVPRSKRVSSAGTGAGLGVFSLGLGLAQILAPGAIARLIGAPDDERRRTIVRAIGLREIATGVGFLSQGNALWLWGRVLGDAVDLALLGRTAQNARGRVTRTVVAGGAVLGVTWLDARRALELQRKGGRSLPHVRELSATVTIGCSPSVVYTFWRDFENLPQFMHHLAAVRSQNGHSRWWAKAPAGIELKWDAEITVDRPEEMIAWQSLHGCDLPNHGAVRFTPAPAGRGTEVHLTLTFDLPGGRLGAALSNLLNRISEQQLRSDLRRLKQLLETGEVVHSDASVQRGMHAARPSRQTSRSGEAGVT